ncbi:MAG: hypothetical protein FJZ01_22380 [Candidatus Sericytochromatia bacterium]|nr:hypothetical protein [Candidatus Tanganyikabacteria bacterium]
MVSGNTVSETITREVTTPGTTTTKHFMSGGAFSLNGLSFALEKTELQVAQDASAEEVQAAATQAAFAQIGEQFAAQSATNDAAGFQKLASPTLDGADIVFQTAYKGSRATIEFGGTGGTAQVTAGTDPSLNAGFVDINGVRVAIAAKSFEITSPDQDMADLEKQAAGYLRDAINAASGQTNVVAGVGEDNALTLVSTLTGSRSLIAVGAVSSSSYGISADTKAASLSAAIQDVKADGAGASTGGQAASASEMLQGVASSISANAQAAVSAQSSALDASAVLSLL